MNRREFLKRAAATAVVAPAAIEATAASDFMFFDMASPLSTLPFAAADVLSEWRVTSGWNLKMMPALLDHVGLMVAEAPPLP